MHTEGSIEINRPVDEVYFLTTDHVAEWSQIVVSEEIIDETYEKVGTTFRTMTEDNGRQMVFAGVVTDYDPPRRSAVQMTGSMFDMDVEYEFENLGGSTRVTQRSDVRGKGMTKVFFALFGWMMNKSGCRALQKELEGLKRYCEEGS